MRSTRIAVSAAMLAVPALSATPAGAAPAAVAAVPAYSCHHLPPLPYEVHTKAVTIRSKASSKSTALGILYRGHKVSGTYVYRDVRMCLS
ncbi:SH3 domain-containing protein [Streptomyces sp. NPDC088729]|uniref:SH3 domain-containing protein n=1 Tax=Streptomyces sp. NPDC088729 TaxID=3365876 RepID=UPI0038275B96